MATAIPLGTSPAKPDPSPARDPTGGLKVQTGIKAGLTNNHNEALARDTSASLKARAEGEREN